jgi:MFS superfamily sulfate permease-like transporter
MNRRFHLSTHETIMLIVIALSILLFTLHIKIVLPITVAAFVAVTIWDIVRKFQGRPLNKAQLLLLDICIICLFIIFTAIWVTGKQAILGIIVGIIIVLLILWQVRKSQRRKAITSEIDRQLSPNNVTEPNRTREAISYEVQQFVWRRDNGRCVKCGSQEKLEYDHIIPISKGGSNTARNIQLLCERCNRSKGANIGE